MRGVRRQPPAKVAILGEERTILASAQRALAHERLDVRTHYGWSDAVAFVAALQPDALVLDLSKRHDWAGWKVLDAVERSEELEPMPVIVWSDVLGASPRDQQVLQERAIQTLHLPCTGTALRRAIRTALRTRRREVSSRPAPRAPRQRVRRGP